MSKRNFSSANYTTGNGTADNAQTTSAQYLSLDPGSAAQMIQILEILVTGLAGASAVQNMQLRRTGTAGTGGASALASPNSDGPVNNFAAAITTVPIAAVAYVTNQPIPSNSVTLPKLLLGYNAFGGIIDWRASPTQEWWMIGTGANVASTLSNNTGSTSSTQNATINYELF